MPVGCSTTWPMPSNTSIASTLCIETSNQKTCWWVNTYNLVSCGALYFRLGLALLIIKDKVFKLSQIPGQFRIVKARLCPVIDNSLSKCVHYWASFFCFYLYNVWHWLSWVSMLKMWIQIEITGALCLVSPPCLLWRLLPESLDRSMSFYSQPLQKPKLGAVVSTTQ